MALITCKDCGKQFSDDAKKCPHCGANAPRRTSLITKLVALVIGIGVLSAIFGGNKTGQPSAQAASSASGTSGTSSPAIITPAASTPVRKPGPAVASMRKKVDQVEKITWYFDKSSPSYNNVNAIYLYLGDDASGPGMRFKVQYTASNWLFIQSALVVIDGEKRGTLGGSWERDNNSQIWEWLDVPVTRDNIKLVRDMANAKKVLIRFEGRQYQRDREVPASELKAMRNVLDAYKELGGTL